jgi:hypothetical protein
MMTDSRTVRILERALVAPDSRSAHLEHRRHSLGRWDSHPATPRVAEARA